MATINITAPSVVGPPGTTGVVPLVSRFASTHVGQGIVVSISAGVVTPIGANPAAIFGVTAHDSNAQYGGYINGATPALNGVLGSSQVNTPLVSGSPAQTLVAPTFAPFEMEINAGVTIGYITGGTAQVSEGTQVGLNIDPTTGYAVIDPTQSNKVAIVAEILNTPGPNHGITASGVLGARYRVTIIPTAQQY